jgi:hypothetical protein
MSTCVFIGSGTRGVTFDGSAEYLSRSSAFTGASGTDTGTFSVWLRFNGDGANEAILGLSNGGSSKVSIRKNNSNLITMSFNSSGGTSLLNMNATGTVTASDGWVHFLASFDLSADAFHVYVDDSDETNFVKSANGNVMWDAADIRVGETPVGISQMLDGDMADLWLSTTYLDLSNSTNRRKFITASGRPAALGGSGQNPTGSSPLLFLRGPASGFHVNRAGTGDFTVTGALSNSATNPP